MLIDILHEANISKKFNIKNVNDQTILKHSLFSYKAYSENGYK